MQFKRCLRSAALLALLLSTALKPGFGAIMNVLAGSDFLTTAPGTTFNGVPFQGVPIGPGSTDTIVERLQNVNVSSGTGTTPIQLIALQLMSSAPANFGLGVGTYFITLQSTRNGPSSTGTMTINFNGTDDNLPNTPEGTFSSFFDVFFDVRFGSLTGPIAMSTSLVLSNSGASWDANPSANDVIVAGPRGDVAANLHTGKINNVDIHDMDFFPVSTITESAGADVHTVQTTTTPEPGTLLLMGCALLGLSRLRRYC